MWITVEKQLSSTKPAIPGCMCVLYMCIYEGMDLVVITMFFRPEHRFAEHVQEEKTEERRLILKRDTSQEKEDSQVWTNAYFTDHLCTKELRMAPLIALIFAAG